jgi:hypothetical protein
VASNPIAADRGRTRRRALSLVLGPIAFYLLVSIAYNQHAWADPTHLYSGAGADPQQTMWFLDSVPHALANHTNPLLTNYLNYPVGVNLMRQTSEPLISLITAPLTAVFAIVVTYNVVVTAATALAGISVAWSWCWPRNR